MSSSIEITLTDKVIKSFYIYGMFSASDVEIDFNENIKIMIGENGIGKTQVLSMFYYTLTRNFFKLSEYDFESIEMKFYNGDFIKFSKSDIFPYDKEDFNYPYIKEISKALGDKEFHRLINNVYTRRYSMRQFQQELSMAGLIIPGDIEYMYRVSIPEFRRNSYSNKDSGGASEVIKNCDEIISHALNGYQILYFPTFRRVEEDLRSLGYIEEQLRLNKDDNRLIHFGMDDIDSRFNSTTKKIEKLSQEGFAKISSEILSQLVKGVPSYDDLTFDSIDINDIQIILSRVGNKISNEDKESIINIVKNGIYPSDNQNKLMLYFLKKLVEIYEKQKDIDREIKRFRNVCNTYLVNKQVVYDESSVDLYLELEKKPGKLLLSKLSSGEKQIISILSKIYLSDNVKYIVLFDEPELSLSIFWQRTLLPDIIASNKCSFLLAVTHSPFIFENELDKYAVAIKEYFSDSKLRLK